MTKTINVMHIRYTYKLGGVERNIINIIKNTDKSENLKHYMILFYSEISDNFLLEELESIGCKVYRISSKETKNPFNIFRVLKIVLDNKIDILTIHECGGIKWMALCKFFIPRLKLVFRINDTKLMSSLTKFERFFTQKIVDRNIVVSEAVKTEVKNNSIRNVIRIYNGVELNKFSLPDKKIDFFSETLKIVNVGWIRYPKKGQDLLIKALGICKKKGIKFSCDFIGANTNQETFDFYNKLIKNNDIQNEINFLGLRENIPELLKNYNLFVFPSRFEGFGLVMIEAMAAGLPVIAHSIDAPKELINHGENGYLFEKENFEDLAEKIIELYQNREKLSKIAENGYKFVQDFDISVMVQNYNSVYKNLIN